MKLKFAAIALVGLVLASCGAGGPEDAVKEFFSAINAEDYDKAKSVSTDDTDAVIDLMAKSPMKDKKEITKVECKVEGEEADCECWAKDEEETQKVVAKKVDGAWKVHMSKSDLMGDAMSSMGDLDMGDAMDSLDEGLEGLGDMVEGATDALDELEGAGEDLENMLNDAMDKVETELAE